ncbi:MAG: prepilin peptidase [Candidatus Paceibacterota bacterium]|jgi:prepilin signal peptidase PulO-like enzyme (type II secretory pathway)
MTSILTIIFFFLGLIIGSFLNVVIFRLNTNRSFGGRSGCMSCQKKLAWYELIPVFSFLSLGGRCRNCKTKISLQYPAVEFIMGLIFALLFLKFQDIFFVDILTFSFNYTYYAIAFSILVVIAVYDLKHKIIPDILSFIFGLLAFMGLFFIQADGFLGFSPHMPTILGFFAGPIIALPFVFFWLVSSGRWMGLGDAKLAIGLGWLLGLPLALTGVVFAFWIGSVVGVLLVIFSKKYGMKSEIPFAPYLALGAFLAFIFSLNLFPLF